MPSIVVSEYALADVAAFAPSSDCSPRTSNVGPSFASPARWSAPHRDEPRQPLAAVLRRLLPARADSRNLAPGTAGGQTCQKRSGSLRSVEAGHACDRSWNALLRRENAALR